MRTFIDPDICLTDAVYFHSFVPLDYSIGEFGIYTNADERNVQAALEGIAAAITANGNYEENADLYQREYNALENPAEAENWIELGNGDSIANSWREHATCEQANAGDVLREAYRGDFMQPRIYEGDIYEYANEYGETVLTESEDEAFSNAENGEDVEEKHGFIAYLSADGYMDRTDAAIYESYEEAAQALFEEKYS